jgi:3-keto-5-aminohexanoate cleavage enzyme
MCSLNVGSINIQDEVFLNPPKDVEKLARRIYELGIEPELDCFDVGHMESVFALNKKGILRDPLRFLLVLGISGGVSAQPRNLTHMVSLLPAGTHWCALGIGRFQLSIATQALVMGGNVRVGLEDTAYYRRGEVAKSNAQLVERIVRIARELGRDIATPDVARRMLGLERHRVSQSMPVPKAMPEANTKSKASAA